MVGGTWAAKETTSLMGTGFDKGLKWARYTAGRVTGFDVRKEAYQAAASARFGQFQQEGFKTPWLNKIYAGKIGDERIKAQALDRFHVGPRDAGSYQLAKEVSAIKGKFTKMDTVQLRARMNSGQEREKLAVRELLKERNQLTNTEQVATYEMYAKNNPQTALNFANSIEYNKLSAPERQAWFNRNTNQEFRKKVASSMAEKGDYNTAAEVVGASTLFTSASDRAIFLRKAIKRLDKTEIANIPATPGFGNSREEKAAIGEVLSEKQALDGNEILRTYTELGPGSEDAEKFIGKIKFESLDAADRTALYAAARVGMITDVAVRQKLFETIIENDPLTVGNLGEMVNSYRTAAEKKDLLKKAQKKDFIASSNVRVAAGLSPNLNTAIQEQIDRMSPEDLADLPSGGKGWADGNLKAAIRARIADIDHTQPPTAPRLTNPAAPAGPGNPWIPGKPGGGEKLKQDILTAIKGNRSKSPDVMSL